MRTREPLSALIGGRLPSLDGRSELVRLAMRLIVEEALKAETRDALRRGYCGTQSAEIAQAVMLMLTLATRRDDSRYRDPAFERGSLR